MPKYPAAHRPLQSAVAKPVALPNRPDGHGLHAVAPASEYWPGRHSTRVVSDVPAGHAAPAVHTREQLAVKSTLLGTPYRPAAHGPEHDGQARPEDEPKRPAGQG